MGWMSNSTKPCQILWLSVIAQDNRECWDAKLRAVVYAYNSAVQVSYYCYMYININYIVMYLPLLRSQESTKYSPFEVMFGRKACLPVDINTEAVQDPDTKLIEVVRKQIGT